MISKLKIWWNDHHEKSHNIFASIHYLVIAIAIVIGGGWSLYTFDILNKAEKAEVEYNELLKSIENTESSTIKIESNIIDYNDGKGLIIEVTLTNNGKEKLYYSLGNTPLTLYQIQSKGTKFAAKSIITPKLYSALSKSKKEGPNTYLTCVALLSKSVKTLSYFIPIEERGLYYATFISKPYIDNKTGENGNQSCMLNDITLNDKVDPDDVRWFASKYIDI